QQQDHDYRHGHEETNHWESPKGHHAKRPPRPKIHSPTHVHHHSGVKAIWTWADSSSCAAISATSTRCVDVESTPDCPWSALTTIGIDVPLRTGSSDTASVCVSAVSSTDTPSFLNCQCAPSASRSVAGVPGRMARSYSRCPQCAAAAPVSRSVSP